MQTLEITNRFKQLGNILSETPEVQRFFKAHQAYQENDEARQIMTDWQQKAQQFNLKRQMGQPVDETQIRQEEQKLYENPVIAELLNAQNDMKELLAEVNQKLSERAGFDLAANGRRGGCC